MPKYRTIEMQYNGTFGIKQVSFHRRYLAIIHRRSKYGGNLIQAADGCLIYSPLSAIIQHNKGLLLWWLKVSSGDNKVLALSIA